MTGGTRIYKERTDGKTNEQTMSNKTLYDPSGVYEIPDNHTYIN